MSRQSAVRVPETGMVDMSWSPDLHIGELRPWPDSVHVVRGRTGETRRYFPESTCKRVYGGKKYGNDKIVCSECGYGIMDRRFNYCPSCGAKIENTVEEYYAEVDE